MRSRHASVALLVTVAFQSGIARAEGSAPPAAPRPVVAADSNEAPAPAAAQSAPAEQVARPAAVVQVVQPAAPVDDPAGAKKLFDEAVALAQNGDFVAACPKLEQSLALHDGLGTQFHLAGCWAKIGRTASSYALFEKVANKSHELGQTEREEVARARMEALLPKLSRVRIDITNPAPKTEVKRDDAVVPASDWSKPIPVDRGAHEVVVSAEGKTPWSTKFDVSDPGVILAVQVPALNDVPKEVPPAPAVEPKPEPQAAPPPPAPEPPPNNSGRRTLAIVVGGVGVAALAAGIFKGAEYIDKNNQAKSICPSGANCTSDEIQAHDQAVDDARKARTWAYVGIGVGSAAVVGATVLFFTTPHAASSQRANRLELVPIADGRGTWGGALHGSF